MDPPSSKDEPSSVHRNPSSRSGSFSQDSDDSHTAAEFIDSQLRLEADAREALPYKFDHCTKPLGRLRQNLFSCLTCNPPPKESTDAYSPAAVCYSCSIQCHGEHTLVELFNKRNFECDCGTTRLPPTAPCTLRINPSTNDKGGAHSETPCATNAYNHNFKNLFCCCECDYEAEKQKGTMFQCLGLGTVASGGCGEDWYHPGCLVGLGSEWYENTIDKETKSKTENDGLLQSVAEVAKSSVEDRLKVESTNEGDTMEMPDEPHHVEEEDDPPMPPGFPEEDDFEGFICYKCVDAHPWIKRYADAPGFLAPVFKRSAAPSPEKGLYDKAHEMASLVLNPKKRKADDDGESETSTSAKRSKESTEGPKIGPDSTKEDKLTASTCKYKTLPSPPLGQISLFFKSDFRNHLCRCSDCFSNLKPHEQLLEEETIYEPSVSNSEEEAGGSTIGSGSIYDRGESALKNVDRVRAIEGVMAYNHLKDQLKPFFQHFAETGQAISAEDIKAHFAKMRGDAEAIKAAGESAKNNKSAKRDGDDSRKEQSGF